MRVNAPKFIVFLFCLFVFGSIWSHAVAQSQAKVLVVYYSRTGHTQLVADKLAKKFGADVEQLIDQHKRTGLFGASSAGKDAVARNTTTIDPIKHNPKDYDIILIGGPSWFGNVTPAVRTFIMQNDLSGKKIGLFGMCHLTGVEHAIQEAADLILKGKNEKFPMMPLRERDLAEEALSKKIDSFYSEVMGENGRE
ncbi:MAG TPA: flavodoxin [Candidatus Omnitrophota bacterium]|nr:flavodoxin [Candidatus Omnitrophota bacterium]